MYVDIENTKPLRDTVIVKMVALDEVFDELILQEHSDEDDITTRKAEVVQLGPDADKFGHCPGLKVGEIAVFTEFAGYFIPTKDDIYKAVRGYDIIGKFKKKADMKDVEKLEATANRVVVELGLPKTEDDIILEQGNDPRQADLSYGTIKSVSPELADKWEVGQGVAFPPYAGTTIRHYESDDKRELRVVVDLDILFTF